jgi:hypothetical protein
MPVLPPEITFCSQHTRIYPGARVDTPVTMMTLPVRSGMSFTPHVGRGGNESRAKDRKPPMSESRCGSVEKGGLGDKSGIQFIGGLPVFNSCLLIAKR